MGEIVKAIKSNKRRMDKINAYKNAHAAMEQAQKYVVAECAAMKLRLTEDELIHAAVLVVCN